MENFFFWNYKSTKEYKIKSYQKKIAWTALFFLFFQFILPLNVRAGDLSGLSFSPDLQSTVPQSTIDTYGVVFTADGNSTLNSTTINHTNINIRNYFTNSVVSTGATYNTSAKKVVFSLPSGTLPVGTYYYYIRSADVYHDGVKFADGSNFPMGWGIDVFEKSLHYFSVSNQNLTGMSFSPDLGQTVSQYTSSIINIQDDGTSKLMNSTVNHDNIRIRKISDNSLVSTGASYDTSGNQVAISVPGGLPVGEYYYYLRSSLIYPDGLKYNDGTAFPLGFGVSEKQNNKFTIAGSYTLNISVSPLDAGSVSKSPNQSTYASGTSVTLSTTANSGYSFQQWTGDCSGESASISILMNSNKNCTANFIAATIPVASITLNSPAPNATISPGSNINFSITADITPNNVIKTMIRYAPIGTTNWVTVCDFEADFQSAPINRTCGAPAPEPGNYKWYALVQETTDNLVFGSNERFFSVIEEATPPEFDLTEENYTHMDVETGLMFIMYEFPIGVLGVNINVEKVLDSQHKSSVPAGKEIISSYTITATDQNGASLTEGLSLGVLIPYPSSQDSLEELYTIMYWTGSQWSSQGIYNVYSYPEYNVITFYTTHLTEFAVLGDVVEPGDGGGDVNNNYTLTGGIVDSGVNLFNLFGLNFLISILLMIVFNGIIGRTKFAYLVK